MILQKDQYYSTQKDGFTTGLHGVHEWSIAFEAMGGLSSDFLEEIVEWYTKNKDLQNLLKQLEMIEIQMSERDLQNSYSTCCQYLQGLSAPEILSSRSRYSPSRCMS